MNRPSMPRYARSLDPAVTADVRALRAARLIEAGLVATLAVVLLLATIGSCALIGAHFGVL